MRITLLGLGSRGDVQPFVALGAALRGRGHDVVLATHDDFRELVAEAGMEFRSIPGSPADFFASPELVAALRKGASLVRVARAMPKRSSEELETVLQAAEAASEGADVVINSMLSRATAFGRPGPPWCSASWWPITKTADFPAMGTPAWPLGGGFNRLTHSLSTSVEWLLYRKVINQYRVHRGLAPLGRSSPFKTLGVERPLFYPFSPALVPPPADWPAQAYVTGYWFWDREWKPSAELTDFLDAGPAPVGLTFGSTWAVHDEERTLAMAVDAARKAGRRLVTVDGPTQNLPDDVLRVHDADYGWLFPRMAAVVHHGGYGTTAAVARAGVPQVIVPTFADHPFWAARMESLGVAPAPVPFPQLSGERLTPAVKIAVTDDRMRERAAAIGARVRADRGPETACEIIETWAARQNGRPA